MFLVKRKCGDCPEKVSLEKLHVVNLKTHGCTQGRSLLVTSWWLNQPLWKICKPQNWDHFPKGFFGENSKNLWSCHHLKKSICTTAALLGFPPLVFRCSLRRFQEAEISRRVPIKQCAANVRCVWGKCYLEDPPTYRKWLGSPPFIGHKKAIYKGSHNPICRGQKLTLVINHLRYLGWSSK